MTILPDSDVLMDFFLRRQPFAAEAKAILIAIELNKIDAVITPVIISNLYYLLRKLSPHQKVVRELTKLISIVEVLQISKNTVIKALNSPFKDFEDALQNYACELSHEVDVIVTRNGKDYRHSSIGVLSPSEFLKTIV